MATVGIATEELTRFAMSQQEQASIRSAAIEAKHVYEIEYGASHRQSPKWWAELARLESRSQDQIDYDNAMKEVEALCQEVIDGL